MIVANASSAEEAKAAQIESLTWLAEAFWNVPTADLLDRFNAEAFIGAGYCAADVDGLRQTIEEMDETALHDAAVDHTSLFALSTDQAPLPYESVYSGSDRQLMKPERDQVFALYQQHGFVPVSDDTQEPEDHISHELRFLAHLLETDNDAAINVFLAEHTNRWFPLFAQEVKDQANTPFYKAITELML